MAACAAKTTIRAFRAVVWRCSEKGERQYLPWRKTHDPYKILVSEVMLQQTQVDRVVPFFRRFVRLFPNVHMLARAPLTDVLAAWSGLGYNRRAKFLRDAARTIVEKYGGRVPNDAAALRALPGVGEYTVCAIRVFAWNESEVLIETNIRTALLHHFFPRMTNIQDRELLSYAHAAARGQDPRNWHAALMDYGAHLKQNGVRLNHRSAHYVKQPKFEGSLRSMRGAILKTLVSRKKTVDLPSRPSKRLDMALSSLARDKLIIYKKGKWRIV